VPLAANNLRVPSPLLYVIYDCSQPGKPVAHDDEPLRTSM